MAGQQPPSVASRLQQLYPSWDTGTHCVPPVFFNRVAYGAETVSGVQALTIGGTHAPGAAATPVNLHRGGWAAEDPMTLNRVQGSDVACDDVTGLVVYNLDTLGRRRGGDMFVISELAYSPNILAKPAWARATSHLPPSLRPRDEGDFDLLLLHRTRGVMVGEVKAVGGWHLSQGIAIPPAVLANKVDQAIRQLDKNAMVVQTLLRDVAPGLAVRKALFLPNVDRATLLQVLANDPALAQVGGRFTWLALIPDRKD